MSEHLRAWTFENLERGNFHDGEMVDGWPVGGKALRHGLGDFRRTVALGALLWHLGRFVVPRGLGVVQPGAGFFPAEGPALLPPDVAFIRRDRLPPEATWDGLCQAVPDLVADVRSNADDVDSWFRQQDVVLLGDYLAAGVRLVWVLDARRRTVEVRRPNGETALLTDEAWLDGEDVLPGFRLPVAALFRPPAPDE
jgi:Uma2 family endonuclease